MHENCSGVLNSYVCLIVSETSTRASTYFADLRQDRVPRAAFPTSEQLYVRDVTVLKTTENKKDEKICVLQFINSRAYSRAYMFKTSSRSQQISFDMLSV